MVTVGEFKKKTPERFWTKVSFGSENECWEWRAGIGGNGYGMYGTGWVNKKSRTTTVHTYSFKCLFGMYSKNLHILHECDNKKCVNPNHLWAGTQQQNNADMVNKGRARKAIGSKAGKSKLTEDQVRDIKIRLAKGEKQKVLVSEYGIRSSGISNIKHGINWKHIVID